MQLKQCKLYALVLVCMSVVVLLAFGGGLFGQDEAWLLQWQHQAFTALCHQIPGRSLWISGQPMAVCSRCMGIYSGFLMGWLLLPLMGYAKVEDLWPKKKVIWTVILINLIDIVGNMLGFWQNTLVSRLAMGALAGVAAAMLFSGVFFTTKTKQKNGVLWKSHNIS